MDKFVNAGTLWKVHVSPKDGPDLSKLVAAAEGAELDRLMRDLSTFAAEFLDFFENGVIPNVDPAFSRTGRIERILLIAGNTTTTGTDFWLFLDGLISGDRRLLDLVRERYSIEADELGPYTNAGQWETAVVDGG